jgi:glycosyltransferase involved in cell wall biosynthesis
MCISEKITEENAPLVGIGVPAYNGALFLDECLNSIQNQVYRNWICIIVDNCSTDATHEIAKKFTDSDSRFRLVKNLEQVDIMANWNKTYSFIPKDAKYFKIVPADDWIMPDFLTEMVLLMEANPVMGVCSSFRLDHNLVRGNGLNWYDGNVFDGKKIIEQELLSKIDVTGSANTVIYRKDFLEKIPEHPGIFKSGCLHGDTDLAYNLLNISDFGFVFKVLSYTRRHCGTITNSVALKLNTPLCFKDEQMRKYSVIIEDFEQNYKNHRINYGSFYIKRIFSGDFQCIRWHNKHIKNKIRLQEVLQAIVQILIRRTSISKTEVYK